MLPEEDSSAHPDLTGYTPTGRPWRRRGLRLSRLTIEQSIHAALEDVRVQVWTAPLLFNISKVAVLGKRPVNFQVAAGPTIASPDAGASWRFRLSATFMYPR